jgi:Tfp pilus assembly protein PilF
MKSRPDDMASHYNLGNFHMARGQMPAVVVEFETATRLQPEALPPYVNAALAYGALGQNDQAESSLRRALRLDPTNAIAHLNLGMLLAELGKLSEAEQDFRAAFRADPQSAPAAFNLGVLLSKEHSDEALVWCRRAAELRPREPKYAYTLAFFLQEQGKSSEAVQTLEKLLQQAPAHADSYALLAQIYEKQKQIKEALSVYRRGAANEKLSGSLRAQFAARVRALSP